MCSRLCLSLLSKTNTSNEVHSFTDALSDFRVSQNSSCALLKTFNGFPLALTRHNSRQPSLQRWCSSVVNLVPKRIPHTHTRPHCPNGGAGEHSLGWFQVCSCLGHSSTVPLLRLGLRTSKHAARWRGGRGCPATSVTQTIPISAHSLIPSAGVQYNRIQ